MRRRRRSKGFEDGVYEEDGDEEVGEQAESTVE